LKEEEEEEEEEAEEEEEEEEEEEVEEERYTKLFSNMLKLLQQSPYANSDAGFHCAQLPAMYLKQCGEPLLDAVLRDLGEEYTKDNGKGGLKPQLRPVMASFPFCEVAPDTQYLIVWFKPERQEIMSVHVSNISWSTTAQALEKYFAKFGPVKQVNLKVR
jgi:hypothetical protein